MNWQPKRYGGTIVSGGSGFSKFIELRALSAIMAFVLFMILYAGAKSSEDDFVRENYNLYGEVLVAEAIAILLLGFLGEALPRFTIALVSIITGITIGLVSLVEGNFFQGKDIIFIYNFCVVVLAYWGYLKKTTANKRL